MMREGKSAAEREERSRARTNITSTIDISMRYLLG
jgi:hypothetical protein